VEEVLQPLQQAYGAQGDEVVTWVGYVVVALILAAAVALVIYRDRVKSGSTTFVQFLNDVSGEVKKITWPSKDELRKATMVILLFVALVAVVIGTMDIVLQWLLVRLPARIS
jgi:preprotein translocase subunit SecE